MNLQQQIEKKEKELAALKEQLNHPQIDVVVVLDESGSMQSIKAGTIEGFNAYISRLKEDTSVDYNISLVKFNGTGKTWLYERAPIENVELTNYNYMPDGGTPLYDTIGETINKTSQNKRRYSNVFFVVITDGEENQSRHYNKTQVFNLITQKTKEDWMFTYLGANQDAWSAGADLGFTNSVNWRVGAVRQVFAGLGASNISYSASATAGMPMAYAAAASAEAYQDATGDEVQTIVDPLAEKSTGSVLSKKREKDLTSQTP